MRYENIHRLPRLDGQVDSERVARLVECDALAVKWRGISNRGCGFPKPVRRKLDEWEVAMVRQLKGGLRARGIL